jgi:type IV pilus assembly protein PilP
MRVGYYLLFLLPLLLLAGCGGGEFHDLQDFVANSGANMRGHIEPPPEVKPYEPFTYDNSAGLPSPFKPRQPERKAGAHTGLNEPDFSRKKEELEDYPLENLKMVGYLYIHNVANAVIKAPDGKLHHVKVGNYMGQNFGKIISITETELKLREMVQDSAGDWSERISTLQLLE